MTQLRHEAVLRLKSWKAGDFPLRRGVTKQPRWPTLPEHVSSASTTNVPGQRWNSRKKGKWEEKSFPENRGRENTGEARELTENRVDFRVFRGWCARRNDFVRAGRRGVAPTGFEPMRCENARVGKGGSGVARKRRRGIDASTPGPRERSGFRR